MYGYADAYSDQQGDYGMPNMSNGPTQGADGRWYDQYGNPIAGVLPQPTPGGYTNPGEGAPIAAVPNGTSITHPGPSLPDKDANGRPIGVSDGGPTPTEWLPAKGAAGPEAPTSTPTPNPGGGALANFSEAAPQFPSMPAYAGTQFKAPTMEEALNDPGARARWQRGQESLQNWAAARGTLNDTDTAKMLLDYGQNSEAQDYGNVYARNFGAWQGNEQQHQQEYGINRQTQYIDPYTAAYNAWVQRGGWYNQNQGTVANTALGFAALN